MAETFATLLGQFEEVCEEIARLKEQLEFAVWRRDDLRKRLRARASGAVSHPAEAARLFPGRPRSVSKNTPSKAIAEVISAVRDLGGQADVESVAVKVNLPSAQVMTRLSRALKLGFIERHGHGQYRLAPVPSTETETVVASSAQADQTSHDLSDHGDTSTSASSESREPAAPPEE